MWFSRMVLFKLQSSMVELPAGNENLINTVVKY